MSEVSMVVEFIVSAADLRQVTGQLKANRGKYSETDFVDILVSECAATFRSVGTETEVPVDGKAPGSVRVPLRIIDKIKQIVPSLKKKELSFLCELGVIRIGTWSVKHPDIEIGIIPDQRLDLPIDLCVLETLAIAEILGPVRVTEEGMRARVEHAIKTRTAAAAAALEVLQPLGITNERLQTFIDDHIREAATRLRPTLKIA
jgi:hypothetical protein